jgi:hypothetical protein
MATSKALSFRVSDAAANWLQSQALPGDSVHTTAKRLIEQMASGFEHTAPSPANTVSNSVISIQEIEEIVDIRVQQKIEELESDLHARLVDQLNELLNQRLAPLEQEKNALLGESAA